MAPRFVTIYPLETRVNTYRRTHKGRVEHMCESHRGAEQLMFTVCGHNVQYWNCTGIVLYRIVRVDQFARE